MERARLLRTYTGRRGRAGLAGGGGEGRPGLRVLRPPPAWISPQVDPRRLFSTSSSCGSSSFEDPDFRPPKPNRKPPRRKEARKRQKKAQGANENQAPCQDRLTRSPGTPSPRGRHVTRRRGPRATPPLPALSPAGGAPLWCSTPELPQLLPRGEDGEGALWGSAFSCIRRSGLRGAPGTSDALPELSLLEMEPPEGQATGGSLVLFEESGGPWRASSPCLSRSPARHRIWGHVDGPGATATLSMPSPSRGTGPGQRLPAMPKADDTLPLRGAFQLQATVCHDGRLALSLPRKVVPVPKERARLSLQDGGRPPKKRASKLNGAIPEEVAALDQSSPRLQPVVLLDNQVVPSWLASHSASKQGAGPRVGKGEPPLGPDSPPGDPASHNQVVPTCGAADTGRKACISGFSSNRWGQCKRAKPKRRKKDAVCRRPADASCLQPFLRGPPKDEELSLACPSSPDASFGNASLWRRIRASFSLHKKKKILSEPESGNSSIASSAGGRSHFTEALRTPFTRTLGYSICPTSSMVRLSSVTSSFASSEATLTDGEKVFGECRQGGPVAFEACIPAEKMRKCEKIGEGVFGEVFKTEGARGSVALKIIPIEGSERVNGEPQKTFSDILPEIIISKELGLLADEELNHTSGFIRLDAVHCVQGAYPEPLLAAWDQFHRLRVSENDRPDFFGDRQLFVVLEFEFGGTDLENMRRRRLGSVAAARSILHQVTASLAVAEEALRFEHRDLHWGNVLVRETEAKEVSVTLHGETQHLPTQGVLVNIIDYTFSRLEKDGLTVYCDLSADEEVFQGRGDYQFDVYRRMREENGNQWAGYIPHSNVLWLHYLADKLLKEVDYKRKATTSPLRQVQRELKRFAKEVLGFRSAAEVLNGSTFFQ